MSSAQQPESGPHDRSASPRPRFALPQADWLDRWRASLERERADFLRELQPGAGTVPSQLDWSFFADACRDLGFLRYAAGCPWQETRAAWKEAAGAYAEVLRGRGTQPALPRENVTLADSGRGQVVTSRESGGAGERDDSLANSCVGRTALYLALAAGEAQAAAEMAPLVFDPPDAAYLGPDSPVCTPDQQKLSLALRYCVQGETGAARGWLEDVAGWEDDDMTQAELLKSVLDGDARGFSDSLKLRLGRLAKSDAAGNPYRAERFLDLPGLALCRLALQAKLIGAEDAPRGDLRLPAEGILPERAGR